MCVIEPKMCIFSGGSLYSLLHESTHIQPDAYKIIMWSNKWWLLFIYLFIFIAIFISLVSSSNHCLCSLFPIRFFYLFCIAVAASEQPAEPISLLNVSRKLIRIELTSFAFTFFFANSTIFSLRRNVWVVRRKRTERLLFVRIAACAPVLRSICLFSRFLFIILLFGSL